MTRGEMMSTSGVLIVAGSETSATLLSGAIYYLVSNPTWLEKVRQELKGSFKTEEEMTFASLGQLKVLNAVLTETFRMYPPVPVLLPRATVEEDEIMCRDVHSERQYLGRRVVCGVPLVPQFQTPRHICAAEASRRPGIQG
ncbi:hypothetical protein PMIN07_000870 [Paraphaeosphaeria minitans]